MATVTICCRYCGSHGNRHCRGCTRPGAPAPRETGPLCRHCHVRLVSRARGLCFACYEDLGIREQYPLAVKISYAEQMRQEAQEVRQSHEPRKPGEPPCRCLWCGRFRCERPLAVCLECRADLGE